MKNKTTTKTVPVSVSIPENILEEINKIMESYSEQGFSVSRSSFIITAVKKYLNEKKENSKAVVA